MIVSKHHKMQQNRLKIDLYIGNDNMTQSKNIHMKLVDVRDTLAKRAHDEWEELGKD